MKVRAFAKSHAFTIVTGDSDFYDIAIVKGIPPKVIWIRSGNSSTDFVEKMLKRNLDTIRNFEKDTERICLELF